MGCVVKTKSGQQRGAQEMVTVDNPELIMRLKYLCSLKPSVAPLYSRSIAQFRNAFSRRVGRLGLSAFGLRPYSLRRGGATRFWQDTRNMPLTLFRGRWSNVKTAKIYLTEGAAMLNDVQVTPAAKQALAMYAQYA